MGKHYYTYQMSVGGQMSPGVLLTATKLNRLRTKGDRDVIQTNWVQVRIYPTFVARVMGQAVCTDNASIAAITTYEQALYQKGIKPPVQYLIRSDGTVIAQWFDTVTVSKETALRKQ